MKDNAHFYWPPSVTEEYLASIGARVPKAQQDRQNVPAVIVKQLDGGCLLYRLMPHQRSVRTDCRKSLSPRPLSGTKLLSWNDMRGKAPNNSAKLATINARDAATLPGTLKLE